MLVLENWRGTPIAHAENIMLCNLAIQASRDSSHCCNSRYSAELLNDTLNQSSFVFIFREHACQTSYCVSQVIATFRLQEPTALKTPRDVIHFLIG